VKRATMAATLVALLALTLAVGAQQPAPSASASAPAASASAAPAGSAEELPPGHPPTDQFPPGHPNTEELPPGHPSTDEQPGQGNKPIPDRVAPDEEMPAGTIDVLILDSDDQPVPNVAISLGILFNSVSKGDSRERVAATTDGDGYHRFSNLKVGSSVHYRINTDNGPATYGSQPFSLTEHGGMKVILHRYDATTSLEESKVLMEAIVLLELKQDTIAINHLLRVNNFGRNAYVATDLRIPFPPDYQGFDKEDTMSGAGIIERDGAMELTGTFPPGQTETSYRYQVPLAFGSEQKLRLTLPPRIYMSRLILKASKEMTLGVAGFPAPQEGRWNDGARVLHTTFAPQSEAEIARIFQSTTPITVDVSLQGLPTPGPKRVIAVLLAIVAVAAGGFYLYRRRQSGELAPDQREDLEHARDTLLGEIALLEKMHARGDVGPKSYESLRNQLLEALARIMAQLDQHAERNERAGGYRSPAPGKRAKRAAKRARGSEANA
jgi:hypothetical protein